MLKGGVRNMVGYVAIFVAAIASMVIGYAWYGPLFGKMWMELSGFKKEDAGKMKTSAQTGYIVQYVASLVTAGVIGMLITATGATTLIAALMVGFWGWLGFIATTMLGSVLWEGKPVKLYLLNNGYHLLTAFVMAAILFSLQY